MSERFVLFEMNGYSGGTSFFDTFTEALKAARKNRAVQWEITQVLDTGRQIELARSKWACLPVNYAPDYMYSTGDE